MLLKVISERNDIPLWELRQDGGSGLKDIGQYLRRRIVGQEEAVEQVHEAVMQARGRPAGTRTAPGRVPVSRPIGHGQDRNSQGGLLRALSSRALHVAAGHE